MSSPEINWDDDLLYEHLTMVIQEFEEAAINSQTREGLLVIANSPLNTMDSVLESASKALTLNKVKQVVKSGSPVEQARSSTGTTQQGLFTVTENASVEGRLTEPPFVTMNSPSPVDIVGGEGSIVDLTTIEFDEDMQGLTGEGNLKDYLKDCLGCDLRITFDWQLKPIDLLGPIGDLVKDINLSMDSFERQMDPFSALGDLCNILNNINWLCLPDLIAILMSFKLLLKSYLSFQLKINLDWTVIIGPLLKLILDAIASLIQAIAGVLLGPLDCVIGALKTIAEMEKALRSTVGAVSAVIGSSQVPGAPQGTTSPNLKPDITVDTIWKDVHVVKDEKLPRVDEKDEAIDKRVSELVLPVLNVKSRKGDQKPAEVTEWSFPSGIEINSKIKLPDSLKDPRFSGSHWTSKMILVVQEAKNYILSLVQKILGSLNSLKGLVSGGLGIQLGNLGLLLFVKDMISLVIIIIRLLSGNRGEKDWCSRLERHPELLEEALARTHGKIDVSQGDRALVLAQGPKVVGTIRTCGTDEPGPQQQMLDQWIKDLKKGAT